MKKSFQPITLTKSIFVILSPSIFLLHFSSTGHTLQYFVGIEGPSICTKLKKFVPLLVSYALCALCPGAQGPLERAFSSCSFCSSRLSVPGCNYSAAYTPLSCLRKSKDKKGFNPFAQILWVDSGQRCLGTYFWYRCQRCQLSRNLPRENNTEIS